jgi:catechol 2,3-dioxygenase-like lactoylglutathione lyase family enzyme
MTEFSYDHVHLRSPNPDETAAYYERMFGAEIIKSVMSNGIERTDMNLGGVMVFIAQVPAESDLAEKPEGSFVGLDHLGLRVRISAIPERSVAEIRLLELVKHPTQLHQHRPHELLLRLVAEALADDLVQRLPGLRQQLE